jgi:hypothetical protein
MSNTPAYPLNVPAVNYNNVTADIVAKYKYTYVAFATVSIGAVRDTSISGYVTLSSNYSNNNTYFIYGSFENLTQAEPEPNNIVFSDLVFNASLSRWQFRWWFENTATNILSGNLQFAIFFYTPSFIPRNRTPLGYATQLTPETVHGGSRASNFLSDLFGGGSGPDDFVNFFPIICYETRDINETAGYKTGAIVIKNYASRFIVLTAIETIDGLAPGSFNTRDLSAITIYGKASTGFSFSYYLNKSASFKIIFIVMYVGLY